MIFTIAPKYKVSPEPAKKIIDLGDKKSLIQQDDVNKRESKQQQKKIIHLERDIKPAEVSNQGNVFDRLSKKSDTQDNQSKKRTFNDLHKGDISITKNPEGKNYMNLDLKTIIDKEN